ncbi:M20/M25/M40 family metallo-hydrolase [Actinoplanes rectilineatus]|uniref:M20/M25/M40 family metallo-hydrolase n=1 Tax=Actinoplanes rectilineatus TaxID=113571 RepID=UPI0005F2E347|nr:M20/M25/M40 family metallo-hydrolase [Actinoplanes rectilineatus]
MSLTSGDKRLLLELLDIPTVSPLEGGPSRMTRALDRYVSAAAEAGLVPVHHRAPAPAELTGPLPAPVRAALADPGYLAGQPSLVLRLGPEMPAERTVMFNVHLDTVAGVWPAGFDGRRFSGRGAIDAKGPAVALLAGLRAARSTVGGLGSGFGVLVQVVAGEEGGALGVIGTRPLVEAGWTGRLNVFCEPTGGRALRSSTAAATARIRVAGEDSVDDRPGDGHNATVLLGFLAQHLARTVPGLCVAGLHTGDRHNRVYGGGDLLLNLPYPDAASGVAGVAAVEREVAAGLELFISIFEEIPGMILTARDATAITTVRWLKRDLPTLAAAEDPFLDGLLAAADVPAWPAGEPAFTCDAIWMSSGTSTVILGPGDLAANRAHSDDEFADLSDLDAYAATVTRVLHAFEGAIP